MEIKNYNPSFGHSFRVSLCLKNGEKFDFVRPYTDEKLYKTLNSKLVQSLNEKYYTNLRKLLGVPRITKKATLESLKFDELFKKLFKIDSDFSMLNLVRSVYRRNKIGFIVTGPDVSIIENIKGAKHIGQAKSDEMWMNGTTKTGFVKDLSKLIKSNIQKYAENEDVLLRSKDDREIMLKAIFKKTGVKKGKPTYELDDFEFHENTSKPRLKPQNNPLNLLKHSPRMMEEIKKTVENQIYQITGRRMKVKSLDKILYPKID